MALCQRTVLALLAIIATAKALQLAKDVSSEDEISKPTGNRTKPRMLVSEGCDGWKAVIRHAHFILKLHGISTPWRKLYTLHGNEERDQEGDHYQPINEGLMATPIEENAVEEPDANYEEETDDAFAKDDAADEPVTQYAIARPLDMLQTYNGTKGAKDVIDSLLDAYKSFAADNKSLVFRGSWKDISTAKRIMDLSLVARIARKNKLDELVCKVKDCYDNKKFGYPVVDGEQSDLCWKHRNRAPEEYKAFVKPSVIIHNLEQLIAAQQKTWAILNGMGLSGSSLDSIDTEDLLDFEYDKTAVNRSNSAWSSLLKAWGVSPNSTHIKAYLKNHSGERGPPALPKESIYNYDSVEAVVKSHSKFAWMLRD